MSFFKFGSRESQPAQIQPPQITGRGPNGSPKIGRKTANFQTLNGWRKFRNQPTELEMVWEVLECCYVNGKLVSKIFFRPLWKKLVAYWSKSIRRSMPRVTLQLARAGPPDCQYVLSCPSELGKVTITMLLSLTLNDQTNHFTWRTCSWWQKISVYLKGKKKHYKIFILNVRKECSSNIRKNIINQLILEL